MGAGMLVSVGHQLAHHRDSYAILEVIVCALMKREGYHSGIFFSATTDMA